MMAKTAWVAFECSSLASVADDLKEQGPLFEYGYDQGKRFIAALQENKVETKGQDTDQDKVKRRYLDEWTQAVNAHGGFGRWRWAVVQEPGEIRDVLMQGEPARTAAD
jgi:hypothetical protein